MNSTHRGITIDLIDEDGNALFSIRRNCDRDSNTINESI
jgi:hypothetical protein